MIITYKKTLENHMPGVGDECEVYIDGQIQWVRITHIYIDGYIRTLNNDGRRIDFKTQQELYDAIGDV